jgi:hypothetical protein
VVWNVVRQGSESSIDSLQANRAEISAIRNLEENDRLERLVRTAIDMDFPERAIDIKKQPSREDLLFMEKINSSLILKDGHYCMDLPFRNNDVHLPCNKEQALHRLGSVRRKMIRNPSFKTEYCDFMQKLLDKGYAVKVENEDAASGREWYVPHHGVYHPQKGKLRVVFDCSARHNGTSLNDALLSGPNLTRTIFEVLIRFRQENIAVTADIESMFYQVGVSDSCTDFLRFFWWSGGNVHKEPEIYKMVVHPFGAVSSPACANVALHRTALDNKDSYHEEIVDGVLRSFYVDDFLRSVSEVTQGKSTAGQTAKLCSKGGFRLTKWLSNNVEVNDSFPVSEQAGALQLNIEGDGLPVERALGVIWSVKEDTISFQTRSSEKPATRRGMLSVISSVFDPLGIASPFILPARILLQSLCRREMGWDDPIGGDELSKWLQ